MGKPSAADPLGQEPDPTSVAEMFEKVIDARIEMRLVGCTRGRFDGVPDQHLVLELIARGWAVFRPSPNGGTR